MLDNQCLILLTLQRDREIVIVNTYLDLMSDEVVDDGRDVTGRKYQKIKIERKRALL